MGILRTILKRSKGPLDDYWYSPWWYGTKTASGEAMNPDLAETIGAVFACKRLLSEGVGTIPLILYRRRADGGKTRAVDHPVYRLLHDEPNDFQTSTEFREMLQSDLVMRGRAYAEIKRNGSNNIRALHPLSFDRVRRRWNGDQLVYEVSRDDTGKEILMQGDVFALEAFCGKSPIELARESFALARALELYGARFFGNDATPNGGLEVPEELSDQAYKRLKEDWEAMHAGENQHSVALFEGGAKWVSISVPNEHAQFLQSRAFSIEEIARWFNVPAHMIQHEPSAQPRANVEQKSLEFIVYSLRPWLVRWEQAIQKQLIGDSNIFAEFKVEGLLRGDIKTRYEAYAIARQWGWMSENDVRRKENEDPIEGGDNYLVPMNMTPIGMLGQEQPDQEQMREAYRIVFTDAVSKVVKREVSGLKSALKSDPRDTREACRNKLDSFYYRFCEEVKESTQFAFAAFVKAVSDVTGLKDDVRGRAEEFGRRYAEESKAELLALIESNGDDPKKTILAHLDDWARGRAAEIAERELSHLISDLIPRAVA